jgi:hypothetical protein
VKEVIEAFPWMTPMMNYSFPLRLPAHCLFPTMSSRRRFSIVVQGIQETPEHRPDASRFFDLIWLSTCVNVVQKKSRQGTALWHFVSF